MPDTTRASGSVLGGTFGFQWTAIATGLGFLQATVEFLEAETRPQQIFGVGVVCKMNQLKRQFGFRLRQVREELYKTQKEFADSLGVSVDFLSLVERGRRAPSFRNLERIARIAKKPVAYLFTFERNGRWRNHRAKTATVKTAVSIDRRPSRIFAKQVPGAVEAMTRNSTGPLAWEIFEFGDVKVDCGTMEAYRRGQIVSLTKKEFETLTYLIKNCPRAISRNELLNEVWGYESYPTTRTIDNQILHLRKKLETEPAHPKHLRTVRGTGYRFHPTA